MRNILDYVRTELDGFQTKPFNAVDSLVLSQFSYVHLEELVPRLHDHAHAVPFGALLKAERFASMFPGKDNNNRDLLFALAASPRFRDMTLNYYVSTFDAHQEQQFAAVTYQLPGTEAAYVAYRGTDGTPVGWKEDFNMAFMSSVPSQEEGAAYLNAVARRFPGNLRVGGHSKGGNLAVYSAMNCRPAVQDRIVAAFSHDGPGFKDDVFQRPQFLKIQDRILKTLPQASVVGMLLENQERYAIVRSSRFGIMQHDPYSWTVEHGDFQYVDHFASSALYMNKTLHQWLGTLTDEKREEFIDTLFCVLEATNVTTIDELSRDWQKNALAMLEAMKMVDAETRASVMQTIKALMVASAQNLSFPGKGLLQQKPRLRRIRKRS